MISGDYGPDARTGLTARVLRGGAGDTIASPTSGFTQAVRSALAGSSDGEKAAVLGELVAVDDELEDRGERAPHSRLAQVQTDEVANAVVAALLALDQDDLAAHAGRTRYGYVEPTGAAWSLLEAAVELWLEDITRRAGSVSPRPRARTALGTSRHSSG